MKQNKVINFANPVLPILTHLTEMTGIKTTLSGVGTYGQQEQEDFIQVSLVSVSKDTELSRSVSLMVWIYTSTDKGLEHSFNKGEEVRQVLDLSVFHVDSLQVVDITNGSILTDSDYPTHYAQEIMCDILYVLS